MVSGRTQDGSDTSLTRVVEKIDNTRRVILRGNTHPLAIPANDRGPAPEAMLANRMLLLLQRSAQQEAELQTYLRAVQDPNSPQFHRWLSSDEFGRRFGIADADLARVQAWLVQQGFTVNRVASGRVAIEFSGTFGQVNSAFHTSLHQYVVNGEQHWANASDPEIPSALAPVVAGVVALHNFSPRSMAIRGPSGTFKPNSPRIQPQLTSGSSQNGYVLFMSPADAATVYDTPTSLNPAHTGTAYDGSGITIGVAGNSNIDVQQNANYRATFGLGAKSTQVIVDGTDPGENGDAIEAYLDTEVSAGIAPGANVVLYTAADTYVTPGLILAILRAVDSNAVDILNVSFSGCEADQGTAGNQYIYDLWQQAAAQGISVTVSSGDSGSAGCDNESTEPHAQYGLAVNGLASTPYNIAVGGTDFDALYSNFPSSFTNYVNIGNSLPNHRSALSYIPEKPWNDSTTANGLMANNDPWSAPPYYMPDNIIAGGGGASACVTMSGTACSSGYPVPTWQSLATDKSGRNLPDVSFLAGNGLYGAVWGLCTDQDYISATQTEPDCVGTPTTGNNFNVTGVGGTSASAPAFAGMLALAAQKAGGRLGQADYVLYDLAKTKYSTVFHDVSSGNNSVPCTQGTPGCIAVNLVNTYYLSGFNTGTGYDEATGLGSVDATEMLVNWASIGATSTTSSLTLNGGTSALTITHGASVTADVTVTGSGGAPSGPVALVDNVDPATLPNMGAIASFPLTSGSAAQSVNTFPGGAYKVSAHYGGDSSFAESDSNSISVTVNPESSSTDLKVRGYYDPSTGKASATPYYGFIYLVDAQPFGNSASLGSPNGVATGTITFTTGSTTLGTAPLASDGIAELQTANIPGGTNSLEASFPGDASFQASTSSAVSFTVQPANSFLTMSTDKEGYNAGDSVMITATFSSSAGAKSLDSLGVAPTGTVTFIADGSLQLGTAGVTGTAGTAASLATALATFSNKTMPCGNHNITATYSGDTNYAPSSSPSAAFIQVICVGTTITLTPSSTSIKQNQSLQLTANLSTYGSLPGPTGSVLLNVISNADYISAWTSTVQISNGVATATVPPNSLPLGTFTLAVYYGGDKYYSASTATGNLQVTSSGTVTPALTLTMPTAPVNGGVPITLTVAGPAGDPVPTGPVMISGHNVSWPLVNGSVSFTAYESWQSGLNTVQVTYLGDSTYAAGTATGTFTEMATGNVSASPQNPTVYVANPVTLSVSVMQAATLPTPTGTVSVSYGSYTSAPTTLASASASLTIPANTLPVGSDPVTISYSGDAYYTPGSTSDLIQITSAPPGFNLSGSNLNFTAGATSANISTISVTSAGGFTGPVTLTAQITSLPPNAVNQPTLSFGNTSPVTISASSGGAATLTVTTTARTTAMETAPRLNRQWAGIAGSALCCVLLLIGRKRRCWQTWLGLFALCFLIFSGISACGGGSGGGGGGGGGGGSQGTTPGVYTITINGTSGQLSASTTISVTVD